MSTNYLSSYVSLEHFINLNISLLIASYHSPFTLHLSLSHRFLSLPIASYHSPCFLSLSTAPFHSTPIPLPPVHITIRRFLSLTIASCRSPPRPITVHRFLSLSTAFYHSPPLPITVRRFLYHSPLLPLYTPNRVLSLSTASFHSLQLPVTSFRFLLPIASYLTPLCPIIPIFFYHSLELPINLHCSLSLPTAFNHSLPLPITLHCVL